MPLSKFGVSRRTEWAGGAGPRPQHGIGEAVCLQRARQVRQPTGGLKGSVRSEMGEGAPAGLQEIELRQSWCVTR